MLPRKMAAIKRRFVLSYKWQGKDRYSVYKANWQFSYPGCKMYGSSTLKLGLQELGSFETSKWKVVYSDCSSQQWRHHLPMLLCSRYYGREKFWHDRFKYFNRKNNKITSYLVKFCREDIRCLNSPLKWSSLLVGSKYFEIILS